MCDRSNNGLTQFCKQKELTKLDEDLCYIQRRDYDSRRPFLWNTYHHHPYDGSKVVATCYPGQFYKDGYGVGAANVDAENCVKRHPGNVLTNPNVRQELPTLPMQMPRVRGYFDSDTESNLRPEPVYNSKQCSATSEKSSIPYTFQKFDHLCYNPQDTEYIVPEDSFNSCFKNAKFWHRAGEDTRHDRKENYRNGCDWRAKYYPPNLSYSLYGT